MRVSALGVLLLTFPSLLAAQIHIKTFPDYRLHITNDKYDAVWQIRIPEVVAAQSGVFLTSVRPSLEWKQIGDTLSYSWTSTPEYSEKVRASVGNRRQLDTGIQVNTTVRILPNAVAFEIELHNPTDRPMIDVWIDGGCLTHLTERFFDNSHSRTYFFTKDGLTKLSDLDRTLQIRSKYFANPAWFEEGSTKDYEFFWGRSSAIPVEALIVSEPVSGLGAVGIAWENCPGLRQSSDDAHRCMHSSSFFGNLAPGGTITRHGMLLFGDTKEAVVAAYRKLSYRMYLGAPKIAP